MNLSIAIAIFSLIVLFLQARRELLPKDHKTLKKRKVLLACSFSCLAIITILGGLDAYLKIEREKTTKILEDRTRTLEKVNSWRIRILNHTFLIILNFPLVNSYSGFAKIDKTYGAKDHFKTEWMKMTSPEQRQTIKNVENSLAELQTMALEVINLEGTFPGAIPKPLLEWSSTTLKIDMLNVDEYFDPYRPSDEEKKYLNDIGLGFVLTQQLLRGDSHYSDLPKK